MNSNMVCFAVAFGAGQILSRLKRIHAKETGRVEAARIKCRDGTEVIPYVPPTRSEQIKSLKEDIFDVLVIGGGCVGSGVALDASKRGFKTAMVEADDFGAGTTGRSTKLIHGGIRYLEMAFKNLDIESYKLVEEALEERAYMLQAAPYMNHPLPIMIPVYTWWELPYLWLGVKVYDWLAGSKLVVPPSHFMSRGEAIFNFPKLKDEGLKGGIIYYDGQMNDARLSLVIALTATQQGASIANRVKVIGLVKDDDTGQVKGAAVRDDMTGEEWKIKAKAVINATGCFCDSIRKMDNPEARDLVIPAAGVHIMLPAHFSPSTMGLIVPKTSDGRVLFIMPWEGATLAGTTDGASELTMLPKPTDEEINFIIQESNRYLSHRVHRSDVIAAWSGFRPLVRDPKKFDEEGTKALSRNHVIEVSDSKLVTVTGGKWTTFRRMAEDTVNMTQSSIPNLDEENIVSTTAKTALGSLIGADRAGVVCDREFDKINVALREEYMLSDDVAKHLVGSFGTRALQIADIVRRNQDHTHTTDAARRLSSKYPYLEAEVVFAVEQEYALKAVDVLARRTRLAFVDSKAAAEAAPRVVEIMAELLQWSRSRRRQELLEVEEFIKTMGLSNEGRVRRKIRRF